MESENIDEVLQEGGQVNLTGSTVVNFGLHEKTLQTIWNTAQKWDVSIGTLLKNFTTNGTTYTDRPLLLSDLALLMTTPVTFTGLSGSALTSRRSNIQTLFDNVPLAQYKHLPDIDALVMNGGSIDETTLETQEVSLPSDEEVLPSLDIVESSSVGGSYKRSSHKKKKSTRIRTRKNKKL